MAELSVHLKVCEGCGSLWFRASHNQHENSRTNVYCRGCSEMFMDFPAPQMQKRRGRPSTKKLGLRRKQHSLLTLASMWAVAEGGAE